MSDSASSPTPDPEDKVRKEILVLARDFRAMTETAGWARMEHMLRERPAQIGMEALEDDQPKEYWRGRLHEAQWTLSEIARIISQGEEIRAAEAEKRKMDAEAVRAFLGKRGGSLA